MLDCSCSCGPHSKWIIKAGRRENQSRFLGRGCDEALFTEKPLTEKNGFSVKRGEAIQ